MIDTFGSKTNRSVTTNAFVGAGVNGFYSPDAKSINDIAGPFDTVSIGGGLVDAIELQAASGATANEVGVALPYIPCGAEPRWD